jgi:hypothetical protein
VAEDRRAGDRGETFPLNETTAIKVRNSSNQQFSAIGNFTLDIPLGYIRFYFAYGVIAIEHAHGLQNGARIVNRAVDYWTVLNLEMDGDPLCI